MMNIKRLGIFRRHSLAVLQTHLPRHKPSGRTNLWPDDRGDHIPAHGCVIQMGRRAPFYFKP